ncbi:MAG: S8 family serine peptidase [Caldilineaceae bacterium]|nr:S8 family serine peptidase [Caldilineaceae bacterium]
MAHCPRCGKEHAPAILAQTATVQPLLARLIATDQPGWQPAHGLCPDCVHHYAQQAAAQRTAHSLHTTTTPPTTFPYYHPAEETVLSQAERLPAYDTVTGRAVTVAFLDSGYYPHPDLITASIWPGSPPPWATLSPAQWQAQLAQVALRFAHYVDLTDQQERVGLEQPSLWDGAGDSWHGQMTSTLVAGNGLLSGGRYRGYAAEATVLPIKIGRGGGRIPEEDILRGLEWLLRDDNWARYGVRVLNISVGGDFIQPWERNPVCLAAAALVERGVVVAAAAGNRGAAELKAPAQTPTVLTVGGVDDANRRWLNPAPARLADLSLYPHNYGTVTYQREQWHKPEILALGRWLPAPILPVSPIFREMAALGELRQTLLGYHEDALIPPIPPMPRSDLPPDVAEYTPPTWMPAVWQAVRHRMNAHKWVHPYYQQVDGTSVAVAQVSAVAAQMVEANPHLTVAQVRSILQETALSLPGKPAQQVGAGLLQPYAAVATALRVADGPLTGYPWSGSVLTAAASARWQAQGLPLWSRPEAAMGAAERLIYVGLYAPTATRVSVIGAWNGWQPHAQWLQATPSGWWHGLVQLPPGRHLYRFWREDQVPPGCWLADPENPVREESGYSSSHSVLQVA